MCASAPTASATSLFVIDPISPGLLELVRCPRSGQRLSLANTTLVATLERQRLAGTLPFSAAVPQLDLSQPITAALVREDRQLAYPIQGGIPILLPDHGIEITV